MVFIFITRLDALIADKGISKAQFVRDLKLGKNAILYWRKGNLPNSATLDAIAEYFDVTTDYLLAKTNIKKTALVSESGLDYEIIRLFESLPPADQAKMIEYAELLRLRQSR